MADTNYLQELQDYFSDVPFWRHIGCVIEDVADGHAVLSLKIEPHHLNGNLTVHGGVYATLLDNAMGLAARATAGRFQATTHMNVHFLAAVDAGTIYARGRVVHRTKRTVTTEARVETKDGTLLAIATGTFRVFQERA
ncbi:PaaI family thioesterase [Effusibacillus pohliae]|uniref:PaaI family thioesterase n=1 Tax=Effusibacillus pohliae TaxID=232270 RepID=UPI00035F05B9|nr:PaaI family thioesterase [Effusibacillus pohliae]